MSVTQPTPPQQEIGWLLPRDTDNLKRDATYLGAFAAIADWPNVVRDTSVLEAQARAKIVIVRTQYREALTNDFQQFALVFIRWYTYGYQFQIVRYSNDASTVFADKANIETVSRENLWEEVFKLAASMPG